MRKISLLFLVILLVVPLFAGTEQRTDTIDLMLELESALPQGGYVEVGFSKTKINASFSDVSDVSGITSFEDGISLKPDSSNGKFAFDTSDSDGLYAYARIQSAATVDIQFVATPLEGYDVNNNKINNGNADMNWILSVPSNIKMNIGVAGSVITDNITVDGTETVDVFKHRSQNTDKMIQVYCVPLDIDSADGVDFREIAMKNNVKYWKTTLTIKVSGDN